MFRTKGPHVERSVDHARENCKVGVWSIFRLTTFTLTVQSLAENVDLTPSLWTLTFSCDHAPRRRMVQRL